MRSATRGARPGIETDAAAPGLPLQGEAQPAPAQPRRAASQPASLGQHASAILPSSAAQSAPRPAPAGSPSGPLFGSPLDTRYTFDSFVEGSSNRVALAAARTIADAGASAVRFNPLFVHSTVGLGKTHLLQAIANAAISGPRHSRVVYLTAEYFMWRFATAIRDNDALSLKETLRNIDLLIIDDMQFLQGKSIQHEFCHLLNMLLDSAKQVVVAADRAPWELESLDPRVRSRLQGGVAIEMEGPISTCAWRSSRVVSRSPARKIPRSTSRRRSSPMSPAASPPAAASWKAPSTSPVPPLLRAELSIERVDELLGHLVNAGEPRRVRIEDIQRVVAKHYNGLAPGAGVEPAHPRHRQAAPDRHVSGQGADAALLPEIGRRFGGRDHTTVLHAVRKIEELIAGDSKLSHEIELLKRLINE